MPELPEVETVRRSLELCVLGAVIESVTLRRADIRNVIPADLPKRVAGATIERIERRAKYLRLWLSNGEVLVVHLGMTGRVLVLPAKPNRYDAHDHVVFRLKDGKYMIYQDPRRFGVVTVLRRDAVDSDAMFTVLGPEPLDKKAFNASYLYDSLQRRSGAVKPALMDQKLVVGVGNIYASEALFLSNITPERTSNRITKTQAESLVKSICMVLESAIKSGGSTLRNYVDSRGEAGYFQHHFRVYGREGSDCEACGKPIKRIVQAGRASFYCKTCQK